MPRRARRLGRLRSHARRRSRRGLYFPFVAETDPDAAASLASLRFPAGRGISGEVVRTLEAVRVDDAASDPRFYDGVDRKTGVITGPLLAAPFASHPGITGVLQAVRRRGEPSFTDADLLFLIALARGVAVAIGNAELFGRLRESEEDLRARSARCDATPLDATAFTRSSAEPRSCGRSSS